MASRARSYTPRRFNTSLQRRSYSTPTREVSHQLELPATVKFEYRKHKHWIEYDSGDSSWLLSAYLDRIVEGSRTTEVELGHGRAVYLALPPRRCFQQGFRQPRRVRITIS